MPFQCKPKNELQRPVVYQIRLKGHLNHQWTDWFGGLKITLEENGDTVLTASVVDQAALYGLLKKVRDLGMLLISVSLIESDQLLEFRQNSSNEMKKSGL